MVTNDEIAAPSLARRVSTSVWGRGAIGIVVFLLLAELAGLTGVIAKGTLPLMSTALGQAVGLIANKQFLIDFVATLEAWAIGMAITVAVAVPIGLVLGSVPVVRSATRTIVEFLRPIPSVALIPLVVFTASRRLMGGLVNRRLTSVCACAVTVVIVGLNIYLLTTA